MFCIFKICLKFEKRNVLSYSNIARASQIFLQLQLYAEDFPNSRFALIVYVETARKR